MTKYPLLCCAGVPSAPTNLSGSYVVGKALCIQITWSSPTNTGLGPDNNLQPIMQYLLRTSIINQDLLLMPNQTSSLVCGLVAGTNYTFTIAAGNIAGFGNGSNISLVAIGCPHAVFAPQTYF